MKIHHIIAIYSLLLACILPYMGQLTDKGQIILAVPAPILLICSLTLLRKGKWVPAFVFGIYGFLFFTWAVMGVLIIAFSFLDSGYNFNLMFMNKDSDAFNLYLAGYLIILLMLSLPMKMLGARQIKETFDL